MKKLGLKLFNELAAIVSSISTISEKSEKILSLLNEYYSGFGNGIIFQFDSKKGILLPVASRNVSKELYKELEKLTVGFGGTGRAVQNGEMVIIEDIAESNVSTKELLIQAGIKSVAVVPLKPKNNIYGVLTVAKKDNEKFAEEEIEILSEIAETLGIVFESANYLNQIVQEKLYLNATFDAIPDFISIHDLNYNVLKANKALKEAFSLTDEDMKNKTCCLLLHGYNFPAEKCPLAESLTELKQVTQIIDDFKVHGKFEVTTSPLYDPEGNVLGSVHIARNITEKMLMLDELGNQMNFTKTLIQNIDDCMFTMKFDGSFTWLNQKIYDISGYEPDELIGKFAVEIVPDEDKNIAAQNFKEIRNNRLSKTFELKIKHKDGAIKNLLISMSPVFFEGEKTTLILAIAKDITSLKMNDEKLKQSDKLRTMGQLAAGVAHDFNNILAAIIGRTELLKLKFESGEYEIADVISKLKIIEEAATDGANIVKKIQEFSRDKKANSYELVDINSIIPNVIEITSSIWKDEAQKKGKVIKISTNFAEIPKVHGNSSELKEVLSNLIINAVDAIEQHNGEINISTFCEKDNVFITVKDNGRGMSEEVKGKIFEPFFTTKGVDGTGLGLAICYGIINRHDGEMTVESSLEKGTVFTIKLPVDKKGGAGYNLISNNNLPRKKNMKKILVVDDEESVRNVLKEFLEVLGSAVIDAESGEEALKIFSDNSNSFDAVFTDLGMPGLSGWDVIEAVRKINSTIPIIIVTGWGETITDELVKEKGANGLVSKPFTLQTIVESLNKI